MNEQLRENDYWWSGPKISTEEVLAHAANMSLDELSVTLAEMGGVVALMSARFQDKDRPQDERNRARFALARLTEKRKRLRAVVSTRLANVEGKEAKRNRIEDMLEMVDAKSNEDPGEAIRLLSAALRVMAGIEET